MLKNSAALFCLALLATGCSPPAPPGVYVNLDRVLQTTQPVPLPADTEPTRGTPPILPKVSVLSLPPASFGGESDRERAQGRDLAEAARRRAERELESRLRAVYLAEIERDQEEALDEAQPTVARTLREAEARHQATFEVYAEQRGALMTRLILLTGFPDPDPSASKPVPPGAGPAKRRQAADLIREQIRSLDASHDAEVRKIFADADAANDAILVGIQARFVVLRDQAGTRAQSQAQAEMARVGEELRKAINVGHVARMAAVTGKSVPRPALPPIGDSPLATPETPRALLIEEARDQISIWMALKGYRQVGSPRDGRDGTDEFLQWRTSHLPGPLAN